MPIRPRSHAFPRWEQIQYEIPERDGMPPVPNVRIVDYGSDMGSGRYRGHVSELFSGPRGGAHVDSDGDDVDGGRWVVRDGEQFYVSEQTFGAPEDIERRGRKTRLSWPLCPGRARWARYRPKEPYELKFDAKSARFQDHEFADVTAVGFYIAKDSLTNGGSRESPSPTIP